MTTPPEASPAPPADAPAPPAGSEPPAAGAPPATGDEQLGEGGKKALEQERELRKAAEKREKDKDKELNALRQSSMSEAEKAVAEAEQRGRSAAATEYGTRLARTAFDAAAGRRNPSLDPKDISEILELVDLAKFVGDDGEPDDRAIAAAVERLVPVGDGSTPPPSFDGGTRKPAPTGKSMNDLIRSQLGR